jgi:alpha-glucosidase
MGYSFELLVDDYSAGYIRATVEKLEATMRDGWPCWAVSNHDVQRAVTRWGGRPADPAMARMLAVLVCSLRGSVCIYQGEELGLGEADVPFEALRDPYGITFWPNFKGRDGCRTPMPWNGEALAGFSSARPWLPIPAEHRALSVQAQEAAADSVLNAFRAFLAWRHARPALTGGAIRFLDSAEPVLMFERESQGETLLLAFNLSAAPVRHPLPGGHWQALDMPGPVAGRCEDGELALPAHAVYCARRG